MKKTISITISGALFHIEEDAYDALKSYLDSIQHYFASYADSREIINDIEQRIAELLQGRLNAEKQAISTEDLQFVQSVMGTPADFASEEAEPTFASATGSAQATGATGNTTTPPPNFTFGQSFNGERKLVRITNDKILAGVCSGLAYYTQTDPIFIRILFVALFFGFWFIPAITFAVSIGYLIAAVVMPEIYLENYLMLQKRFFRDQQSQVIGGVANGLASYLSLDVTVVRILFVLLAFAGGFGIAAYLVIWVSSRYAISNSERTQMRGEPINLRNVGQTARDRAQNLANNFTAPSRTQLEQVLYAPFKLLGALLRALTPLIKGVGRVVAGFFGVILLIVALSVLIAAGITASAINSDGLMTGSDFFMMNFDGYDFTQVLPILPPALAWTGFGLIFIPGLLLVGVASALISFRWVFNRYVTLTLLVIWGLLGAFAGYQAGRYSNALSRPQTSRITVPFTSNRSDTLVVGVHEVDGDRFRKNHFNLRYNPADTLVMVQTLTARAFAVDTAKAALKAVSFNSEQSGSFIRIDDHYTLDNPKLFAFQNLESNLFIPAGQPFIIRTPLTYEMSRELLDLGIDYWALRDRELENQIILQFDNQGRLRSLNHPELEERNRKRQDDDNDNDWTAEPDEARVSVSEDEEEISTRVSGSGKNGSVNVNVDVVDDDGRKKKMQIRIDSNGVKIRK